MRRSWPDDRSRRGRRAALLLATVCGILAAILPPVAASSVAATASAPSPGYTASQIPIPGVTSSSTIAVNSTTNTIYLGSFDAVTVANGATRSVTTTITLPGAVEGIAVDAATNRVYVTLAAPQGVAVIDGATNSVITTIPVVGFPTGVAVDTATDTVYVADSTAAAIIVIAGATNAITTTIGTGLGTRPSGVAVDESTDVVWVADAFGSLIEINGSANSIIGGLAISGSEMVSVAVNTASNKVYATDERNGDVVVVDGQTGSLITLIPAGLDLVGIAVDQSSGVVYASGFAPTTGTTWVIDGSSNVVANSIARGSFAAAVNQSTGTVYEAAWRFGAIWVITASAANAWSPIITTQAATVFTTGIAAKFAVAASALPLATFAETGAMPAGVTLSPNGVLSGTASATAGGSYPITITASNGIAPDYSQHFNLIVFQPPAITAASSATFQVGSAGTFEATATGYPLPSFSASGTLPTGVAVTILPGSWQLSGTPAVGSGGVYPIALTAFNGVGPTAQQALTLTVDEAPSITSAATTRFRTGASGSFSVTSRGYPAPTFAETGKLPAGVTLSPTGTLSGTPAAGSGGKYPITVTASNGIGSTATQAFTLIVRQPPAFTSPSHVSWGTFRRHTFTFRTTGFPAAILSERGALPSGVTFTPGPNGTAVLAGRPPRADRGKTFVITVTARNGVGTAVRQTFRLTIV